MAISIDTQQQPDPQPVSIDDGSAPPLSDDLAIARSKKAAMGIGGVVGKDFHQIYSDITSGNEDALRSQAASTMDQQNAQKATAQVKQAMLSGGILSPEDLTKFSQPSIDPKSVIEQGYGHAILNHLDFQKESISGGNYQQANFFFPNLLGDSKQAAADMTAYREYALTKLQNSNQELSHQSWGGWLWETAKDFGSFGLYGEYMGRGNVPDVGFFSGGGIGTNQERQTRRLLGMPFDKYKANVDQIYENLNSHSPQAANAFLQALVGQGQSDILASNIGTGLTVGMLPGVSKVTGIGRALESLKAARQGLKDVVKEAAHPDATPASLANAAGDADMSAVHQFTSNMMEDAKGTVDLQQRQYQVLTSDLKSRYDEMRQNAGRFGQENVNKMIARQSDITENVVKQIEMAAKVDRVPEMTEIQANTKAALDEVRGSFRDLGDDVMDVKGPHWEPYSNTWWFEAQLSNQGRFFKSMEEAENYGNTRGIVVNRPGNEELRLQKQIAELESDLRTPPEMEDDVHGLNAYEAKEKLYNNLKQQLSDLQFSGEGFKIKPQGTGYYISYMKPLKENSTVMSDMFAKTEFNKIYNPNWFKSQLGRLRTPEEVLAEAENHQRKIATFAPAALLQSFSRASESIGQVSGKNWDRFVRVLEHSRRAEDPEGRPGYFFRTPAELEDHYVQHFHDLPTEAEYHAYFDLSQAVELELGLRRLQVYKNKARLGAEQHRIIYRDENGQQVKSPFFDGMLQNYMPNGTDSVAVIEPNGKLYVRKANSLMSAKKYKDWREAVEQGQAKVIRLYDPETRPLQGYAGIDDERIRYVITRTSERKPLDLQNQVNRRGGFHFNYDSNQAIKQANIREEKVAAGEGKPKESRFWYEGDKTVMAIPIRQVGKNVLPHLNKVRELIKENKLAEAEAYNNQHLPIDWKEHFGWYTPQVDVQGRKVSARLNVNEPLHLVDKNHSVMDVDKVGLTDRYGSKLLDGIKQGSDARQYQLQYTQPRDAYDLHAMNDIGTHNNPVYSYQPAAFVDPMTTYNRALSQIVNETWMSDMKMYSMTHWLEQAAPLMTGEKIEDIRRAPFHYYMNAENYISRHLNEEQEKLRLNLMSAKAKIDHFAHTTLTSTERQMFAMSQRLIDSVYNKAGPGAAKMLSDSELARTRDPLAFARGATFHMKLGLFNPPAFFTQLSTNLNVYAISPRSIFSSTAAMLAHEWARINQNPEIMAHLDNIVSKVSFPGLRRFRPGEFQEAHNLLTKVTGFDQLGHTHALLDDPFGAKIVRNGWNKILDTGSKFFEEGARTTRMTAFYTSYLERREAIGSAATLGRKDIEWILDRASDLDHNMSRASNSVLHTGWMSLIGQFQAYALRLTELMTGKRLTMGEKARLFATSSVAYGLPLGGLGLFAYPVGDEINRSMESGENFGVGSYRPIPNPFPTYVQGYNPVYTAAMEGLPSAILGFITGGHDFDNITESMRKGDYYNIKKWGPESYQLIGNITAGDTSFWKIIGGAPASTAATVLDNSSPLWRWGYSVINPNSKYFPLTAQDFLLPLRAVSSVNNAVTTAKALNTERYFSTHGTYLTDMNAAQAYTHFLTGLVPNEVGGITSKEATLQTEKDLEQHTMNEARAYIQRYIEAEKDGNREQADTYLTQAKLVFEQNGYPMAKRFSAIAQLLGEAQSLVDRLDQNVDLKKVPAGKEEERMQTYFKKQAIKKAKGKL